MLAGLFATTGGPAAIVLWVAFGSGQRAFQMSGFFFGDHVNEIIGRTIFEIGGAAVGLMFVAFTLSAVRQSLHWD